MSKYYEKNYSTRENKHKSRERRALWKIGVKGLEVKEWVQWAKNMQAGRREGCGQNGELLNNQFEVILQVEQLRMMTNFSYDYGRVSPESPHREEIQMVPRARVKINEKGYVKVLYKLHKYKAG